MDTPLSPRRLAENEVYFRQKNRAVEESFSRIKKMAEADNQSSLIVDEDMRLHFFCECSDENCRKRIPLKRSQYNATHKANDTFVVICGHHVPEIETVIEKTKDYCVIKKKIEPPTSAFELKPTPINNV